MIVTLTIARVAMTAAIAYPCFLLPTIRPNVRGGSEKLIASSRKFSTQFVQVVGGFSNGCAELAL